MRQKRQTGEDAAIEGGLINDRSGQASERLRKAKYRLPPVDPKRAGDKKAATEQFWNGMPAKR